MITTTDVRKYWQEHPLLSYELDTEDDLNTFFDNVDRIKRYDIERFSMDYWEFNHFSKEKILDVGCGSGWITVQYALGYADVYAIDITAEAVELTKKHIEYKQISANVSVGNAEKIDYPDNYFDLVVCSGVLHHTPNYEKAIKECYRV